MKGCKPGCAVLAIGFVAAIALPFLIARVLDAGVGAIAFFVLIIAWFIVLNSLSGSDSPFAFCIETKKFEGRALLDQAAGLLQGHVDRIGNAAAETPGWSCTGEKSGLQVRIAASPVGPSDWVISTYYDPWRNPRHWFRRSRGMGIARDLHETLVAAFKTDPEVRLLWDDHRQKSRPKKGKPSDSRETPVPSFTDPKLGLLQWSEDEESWKGKHGGMDIALSYEGRSHPSPELLAYALGVLEDATWLATTLEWAKQRTLKEMSPSVAEEIRQLHFESLGFSRSGGVNRIFGSLAGGEGDRFWRIEYYERSCRGLGFDD